MDDAKLHVKFRTVHSSVMGDHESKGSDYESDEVQFTDSYPNMYALWLQVNRKACRLKALIGDPTKQKTPRHESIADNARDLASFAIWLAAWAEIDGEKDDGRTEQKGEGATS